MKNASIIALALAAALLVPAAFAEDGDLQAIAGNHNREHRPIIGMAAQPAAHTAAYRGGTGATGAYNCANTAAGGSRTIRYPFTVPNARALEFVRIWGFKGADTADTTLRVRKSCMTQAQVDPVTTILDEVTITGAPGQFSTLAVLGSDQPDNLDCRYWVELVFGSSAQACATNTSNLRIERIRVQSLLQNRIFRGTFRQYTP